MDSDSLSTDTQVVRYVTDSLPANSALSTENTFLETLVTNEDDRSSEEFDSGSDLDDDFPQKIVNRSPTLRQVYSACCYQFCVIPCSPFVRKISDDEIDISHYNVGPNGCKAIAKAMKSNTTTTLLNISDNGIETIGAIALAGLLRENYFLTVLDVSMNFIGKEGIQALCSVLQDNRYLQELCLASNNINDKCIPFISNALKENGTLRVLDLSTNDVSSDGASILADAVSINAGLMYLNVSGNFIRNKGAIKLLEAIQANSKLRSVDLSFNGLDGNVAVTLENLLKLNNTLRELDISRNRFYSDSAQRIAVGLEKNVALRVIKVGWNPIQCAGAKMIIDGVAGSDVSVLEELYLDDIPVTGEFEAALDNLFDARPGVYVQFGTRVRGKDHKRRKKEQKDLVSRILDYIEFRGIRMMDFFRRMDKNGKMMITKDQFRKGLQIAEIPMSGSQLDRLFGLLDENDTGYAKYRDFAKVLRPDFHGQFAKKRSNFKWDH